MDRAVTANLNARAIPISAPVGDKVGVLNGPGYQSTYSTFATGYDGAETVMPFMLDYSLLDGPDVLTD